MQIPTIRSVTKPMSMNRTVPTQRRNLVYPHINREPLVHTLLWNPRSIRPRSTALKTYVTNNDVDIVFLVETWLASDDPIVIGELKPDEYTFINIARAQAMLYKTQFFSFFMPLFSFVVVAGLVVSIE